MKNCNYENQLQRRPIAMATMGVGIPMGMCIGWVVGL